MFFGEFEHTIDEKGRIFMPARHRDALGDVVYLWRGWDGQLMVYPFEAWQQLASQLAGLNQMDADVSDLTHLVFTASECAIDRQGRITIPPRLRQKLQLGSEVIICGKRNHLEIWDQARYDENDDRLARDSRQIASNVASQGLSITF